MDENYSIGKLAKEAGVSVRTIRFYIDEGLLPAPQVHGRNTFYDDEYLDRLKLIRRLKDAFLPLREIRQKMQGLQIEEVRELLSNQEFPADYPSSNIPETALMEKTPRAFNTIRESTNPEGENAAEYIARILDAHATPRNPNPVRQRNAPVPESASGTPPATVLQTPPARREKTPRAIEPAIQPKSTPGIRPHTQSSWQRIVLIPGIELHVSEAVYNEKRATIQHLVEWARQLFETKLV